MSLSLPLFRRSVLDLSILIVNALDHFNSSLYFFITPILAPIFFAQVEDPIVRLILAYGILTTSIITHPIGSVLFGWLAQRKGPLVSLSISLLGLGLGSITVGFLPSFENYGWIAPVLLTLCKAVQGIFSSGERAVAQLYIMEDKTTTKAFQASNYYHVSTMVGIIAASFVTAHWGSYWRTCMVVSGLGCCLGCLLRIGRRYVPKPLPPSDPVTYGKHFFFVLATASLGHVTYSVPFIVMNHFHKTLAFSEIMSLNTFLLWLDLVLIMMMGPWLKHKHPGRVLLYSSIVLAISSPILMYSIDNLLWIRFWLIVWGLQFSLPLNVYYRQRFAGQYLMIGSARTLGTVVMNRLTPPICLGLFYYTEGLWSIGAYIGAIAAISAWFLYREEKNHGRNGGI